MKNLLLVEKSLKLARVVPHPPSQTGLNSVTLSGKNNIGPCTEETDITLNTEIKIVLTLTQRTKELLT